ncbi:MAG: hypothetical protein OXH98_14460 [Caldilineaceae bacterium]|nr:hypothetical protein [Caldilineaceae bacterium]
MDKKLVMDVLETAGKFRDVHRSFDPLVERGYSKAQIDEAVSFCLENRLLDKSRYRSRYDSNHVEDHEWWAMGVTRKGALALEDLDHVSATLENRGLYDTP